MIGVSVSSLHRESTDSILHISHIIYIVNFKYKTYYVGLDIEIYNTLLYKGIVIE